MAALLLLRSALQTARMRAVLPSAAFLHACVVLLSVPPAGGMPTGVVVPCGMANFGVGAVLLRRTGAGGICGGSLTAQAWTRLRPGTGGAALRRQDAYQRHSSGAFHLQRLLYLLFIFLASASLSSVHRDAFLRAVASTAHLGGVRFKYAVWFGRFSGHSALHTPWVRGLAFTCLTSLLSRHYAAF